eukprot:SAG22_NODE_4278_length_1319_cov_1.518033_2_plen_152_part_00
MADLSYSADPARDPLANASQLGAGKVNLQFCSDTRAAFRRRAAAESPRVPIDDRDPFRAAPGPVDWNVCFSDEPCDQYGNTPTTVPEELLEVAKLNSRGIVKVPAGLDRFTFWYPDAPIADDARLPGWIRTLAQGKPLQRGPPGLLPAPRV